MEKWVDGAVSDEFNASVGGSSAGFDSDCAFSESSDINGDGDEAETGGPCTFPGVERAVTAVER